jgi:hypothetical protein
MNLLSRPQRTGLVIGDVLAFGLITTIGFASHEELAAGSVERMLATFVPFLAAWLLVAPWLGLFGATASEVKSVFWRTPLAALLAAPLGGWLRGLLLGAPILPVFVLVMVGVSALVLTGWRIGIWAFYLRPRRR